MEGGANRVTCSCILNLEAEAPRQPAQRARYYTVMHRHNIPSTRQRRSFLVPSHRSYVTGMEFRRVLQERESGMRVHDVLMGDTQSGGRVNTRVLVPRDGRRRGRHRGVHLQQRDEVLLLQVGAAGFGEQGDEPRCVVVATVHQPSGGGRGLIKEREESHAMRGTRGGPPYFLQVAMKE